MGQQIPFFIGKGAAPGLGRLAIIQAEDLHAGAGASAQRPMRQVVCGSDRNRHLQGAVTARDRIGLPLSHDIFAARKTLRKKMSVVPRMIVT